MNEEGSKKSISYSILYAVAYLHSLLPFSVLYLLSDILYFIVYHVVRYRKKVVRKNLRNSFPDKSDKEIKELERKFYHHLCDYFVETIKTLNLSEDEMMKRMKFENPELITRLTSNGGACVLSLGHYGNWEWVPSICLHIDKSIEAGLVYKELSSGAFDKLFYKIRRRFNSVPIEMNGVFRKMINARNEGKRIVVGFLTDQRPKRQMPMYWMKFLNQDTPVQTGMERISKKLSCSIVYLDITKVKRGHYNGKFFVVTPDASVETENVIMERYMNKLEETIIREPAYYLWSHDRWKFKKPETK